MKKVYYIIFITIFFSCNNQESLKQIEKNDVEKDGLIGKVKILEEKNFIATEKFGKPIKLKLQDWRITTFNILGNIIEEKTLYDDGEICSISKIKYNTENKIIERTHVCGENSDIGKYIYDKNGNNIEFTYYQNGEISVKQINKFDKNNNLIDHRLYQYDGILKDKTLSKFNDYNLEIESEEYSFDGTSCVLTNKKTIEYDNKGNLIEEKNYDEKGNLEFIYKYVYDEKNNEIEKILSKDNSFEKNTRTLDKFNNCIKGFEYLNNNLKSNFTNNYKYDKKGNWIQRIHFNNDIANRIDEKNIEYYN